MGSTFNTRDIHIEENNQDMVESMLADEEKRAVRRSLADLQEALGGRPQLVPSRLRASGKNALAADTKAIQELGNADAHCNAYSF